jgi:methylated-DNA-[protein]-cysteine S-methyltransferase
MSPSYQAKMAVPFGVLGICTQAGRLTAIDFLPVDAGSSPPLDPFTAQVVERLSAWFEDPATVLDLPLELRGTPFQRRVWEVLKKIPTGCVMTYGELARKLATSSRAVGQACAANPVPIVVPCHRVVARGGAGGFNRGHTQAMLAIKEWLLTHERRRAEHLCRV